MTYFPKTRPAIRLLLRARDFETRLGVYMPNERSAHRPLDTRMHKAVNLSASLQAMVGEGSLTRAVRERAVSRAQSARCR